MFAALGDATRLALVVKLSVGPPLSIARLTEGFALSRQAVTKHLQVLEEAGLVRAFRRGRENLFALEPEQIDEVRRSLDRISKQWDVALANLKEFAER
ncbi:MAG: ArsR/SmtB family transcription factor [Phycisphaerales bacterium]